MSTLTNHGSVVWWDDLLCPWWQFDPTSVCVRVVRDDSGVIAWCPCQTASVTHLLLQTTNDGSFRHHSNWQYVANLQTGCKWHGLKTKGKVVQAMLWTRGQEAGPMPLANGISCLFVVLHTQLLLSGIWLSITLLLCSIYLSCHSREIVQCTFPLRPRMSRSSSCTCTDLWKRPLPVAHLGQDHEWYPTHKHVWLSFHLTLSIKAQPTKIQWNVGQHQYLDNTLDVPMSLGIIDCSQGCSTLPVLGMGLEDATGSFPLTADHTTHPVLGQAVCVT